MVLQSQNKLFEDITVALLQTPEALNQQCLLDYSAAKKCVDCSAQMGAYCSSLRKVREWKKTAIEELLGKSFVNFLKYFIKYYATQNLTMKQILESLFFKLLTEKKKQKNIYTKKQLTIAGTR